MFSEFVGADNTAICTWANNLILGQKKTRTRGNSRPTFTITAESALQRFRPSPALEEILFNGHRRSGARLQDITILETMDAQNAGKHATSTLARSTEREPPGSAQRARRYAAFERVRPLTPRTSDRLEAVQDGGS